MWECGCCCCCLLLFLSLMLNAFTLWCLLQSLTRVPVFMSPVSSAACWISVEHWVDVVCRWGVLDDIRRCWPRMACPRLIQKNPPHLRPIHVPHVCLRSAATLESPSQLDLMTHRTVPTSALPPPPIQHRADNMDMCVCVCYWKWRRNGINFCKHCAFFSSTKNPIHKCRRRETHFPFTATYNAPLCRTFPVWPCRAFPS